MPKEDFISRCQAAPVESLDQPGSMTLGRWGRAEKFLLIAGIIMLSAYAVTRVHSLISSRLALQSFEHSLKAGATDVAGVPIPNAPDVVDFSIWSPKRIQAYRDSLSIKVDRPLAILRIPNLRIEVPVFDGTDDLTLNRGVGWISGTARIGEFGNIGIAGHRDGFFRGLKDIAIGEKLQLVTPDKTIHYVVEQIGIVQPEDVAVLADRGAPALTLVTCFPFYFVGDAPQRFIVHAKSAEQNLFQEFPGPSANSIKSKENVN